MLRPDGWWSWFWAWSKRCRVVSASKLAAVEQRAEEGRGASDSKLQ